MFQIYCVLTLSCNLNCPHCIRKFSSNNTKDNLLKEDFENFINSILRNFKQDIQLIITGGEPTLHSDFIDIVRFATEKLGKVGICSNGVIPDSILVELAQIKNIYIQISIDGDLKTHDSIRGNGTYNKAIDTIKYLTKYSIPVIVSSTVNTRNIDSMFSLALALENLGLKRWQLELEQTFSFEENSKRVETNEWNSFVDRIIEKTKLPLSIKKLYDFDLFEKMENKYGKDFLRNSFKNCGFCSSKFYLYPDLTIRACTCLEDFTLGNLKLDSLDTILEKMNKSREVISVKKNSPCVSCRWLYFCNGGCPGYSYFYKKDFGYGDVRCPKVRMYYENR